MASWGRTQRDQLSAMGRQAYAHDPIALAETWQALDFVKQIRLDELMNPLLGGIRIHQPGRGRNTA